MKDNKIYISTMSLTLLVGENIPKMEAFAEQQFKQAKLFVLHESVGLEKGLSEILTDIEAELKLGKLTVIILPYLLQGIRNPLKKLAKQYYMQEDIIVFNKDYSSNSIENKGSAFSRSVKELRLMKKNGIHLLSDFSNPEIILKLPKCDRFEEKGPFDIIGDVHGCIDELLLLVKKLGYDLLIENGETTLYTLKSPTGRRLLFVGDLVDRGPNSAEVLRFCMQIQAQAMALFVPGNHDDKLMRNLSGRKTNLNHGLEETLNQLKKESVEFREQVITFFKKMPVHLRLDDGRLLIAHAGLKEAMHGRGAGAVKSFCLYGATNGQKDEYGMPIRFNWAARYKGEAMIIYGHTPVPEAVWQNNTMDIDTGCCFGGKLTALRYPEKELVQIASLKQYSEPGKPIQAMF